MITTLRAINETARGSRGMLAVVLALFGLTYASRSPAHAATKSPVESVPDDEVAPVPPERAAAEKIRALGGWYSLDNEHYVVEINMVYHYDADGERHDNQQKTDQALALMPEFPRLRRLLLTETQVSDDGLQFVGRLPALEELVIWGAATVTDKGVAHLRSLLKLKSLKLGDAAITDEAVAHLSHVSSIEMLLLDGNGLTDKSLEYASQLPRLRGGDWKLGSRSSTDDCHRRGVRARPQDADAEKTGHSLRADVGS